MYRRLVKPYHARVYGFIRENFRGTLIMHCCGSIRPFLLDLIEIGVQAINPVQVAASGMNPVDLKRDFGKHLVFWGGGVETQRVFGTGTPDEVRDDVKRSIDALAPGGGFVFCTVHNTQANVPPENFMAMWETLQEYGVY